MMGRDSIVSRDGTTADDPGVVCQLPKYEVEHRPTDCYISIGNRIHAICRAVA